ncbi:lasso peptide biosynthesis B2 protein [Butyrivibrio sp. TB]|uniref:lasso peptide biosynthesis B2 protein n=1 Tax=Butyrivibrio sp. TB TaxID=1520809 RepID=UPI0008BF0EBD|nr:lasso peptide biosynthesis B2 protein [Butyrivibrio sp. TB]SEQ23038.1 Transglutaminase-like superfamily protein [Butyrivibrio sp. TB]
MIDLKSFIFDNKEKNITIKSYIYSFYFRFLIKKTPMTRVYKKLGKKDVESPVEETIENQRLARLYAFHVNRITEHLPWEEKCFVRALTLKKLLSEKKISCTIYLGVKKEENGMSAHAWLRSGLLYISGGTGKGYTIVGRYGTVYCDD